MASFKREVQRQEKQVAQESEQNKEHSDSLVSSQMVEVGATIMKCGQVKAAWLAALRVTRDDSMRQPLVVLPADRHVD